MLKIKIFKEKGDDVVLARIAIVEDDVYMREELENLLKKNGYEVFSILDFENVISCIISYSPDLILLDINLPFYSGFELCKELKSKQLGTVLILTARDRLQDELHALGLGADDYLTKTWSGYLSLNGLYVFFSISFCLIYTILLRKIGRAHV